MGEKGETLSGDAESPEQRLPPVRPGDVAEAVTVGLGSDGEGVARVDGYTLFVPGALPGEQVLVRVREVGRRYGFAELVEVVEPSPERRTPPCPVFGACGGCRLQHLSYAAQLEWKRRRVADALERIGRIDPAIVRPTIGMADPWRYRNHAQVPVGEENGRLVAGFYAAGTHRVVPFDRCGLLHPAAEAAVRAVVRAAEACGVRAYRPEGRGERRSGIVADGGYGENVAGGNVARGGGVGRLGHAGRLDHAGRPGFAGPAGDGDRGGASGGTSGRIGGGIGGLRHIAVRVGFRTGETLVTLVTAGRRLPNADALVERIVASVPGLVGLCHNVQPEPTPVVYGEETRVLWGRDVLYDEIGGLRFAISARSFFQVNPVQAEVLFGKALESASLAGGETVIDAYCGVGAISLFLARRAGRVLGVEAAPEAVADARRNAELNGIRNAEFAVGRAERILPAWLRAGVRADVVVVDPPRKGCAPELLEAVLAMRPARVVYVSCDPATMARDLRRLADGGYRAVEVQPVDMFPQTAHVECCSLLVRKEN
ncbi:MAG: 23S rRNA (uracil-5-)-methyltransferase RumA [Candidatus Reconcilbacillus cellulovorans]|uniref:23S rRNA (Uracil-5-)-methyltransferase RumA n=1 Tax=Candidatus Reconcilbacillus cellulovorans TaxID=1906605 RepID=A0A2A6DZ91_9BACL|nr:MAG: 23S rRNA (uracil-5-)-methyltransferase RumA [Candidatus Reconcilbacillus cellulovorans]